MLSNVLVVGLGLLGGSIALALKEQGIPVFALGRNRDRLQSALDGGYIDGFSTQAEEIVPGKKLIVLGTPVGLLPDMAERIAPFIDEDAALTDIGSTKEWVCKNVQRVLCDKKSLFLGAHPMAGSEKSGFEHSKPDLFRPFPIVITKTGQESERTVTKISHFWGMLSEKIHWMDPATHDRIVTLTSHLPHSVAFAMAYFLSSQPESESNFFGIYGKGLLDTLRIAASDPVMWNDIMKTNRKNIADAIEEFKEILSVLENWIRTGKNEEIMNLIQTAGEMRKRL